ncbi:MAG: ATP-dependent zinc metalloprotease FtsH [Planctomycetia bacterium]|nr:ATP-dependent zinc metalloprotease FtsH [Planctomycetia bacterium]
MKALAQNPIMEWINHYISRRNPLPATVLLSDKQDEKPISDNLYDKIPDSFKKGSSGASSDTPEEEEEKKKSESESEGEESNGREEKSGDQGPKVEIRIDDDHGREIPRINPGGGTFPSIFMIIIICSLLYFLFSGSGKPRITNISWNGFNDMLISSGSGKVLQVNMSGNKIEAELKDPPSIKALPAVMPQGNEFFPLLLKKMNPRLSPEERKEVLNEPVEKTWGSKNFVNPKTGKFESYEIIYLGGKKPRRTGVYITNQIACEIPMTAFADADLDKKIRNNVESFTSTTPTDRTGMIMMIISIGFTVLLIWLIFRMRRTGDQQGNYLSNFGNSPARRYDSNTGKPITFDDVAGLDNVKEELVEIVDFLKNPEKYERMGAQVPKGTLLFGPPGTGKTLLGRAVAGEAGVPFFSINGSEFIQMYVGVGASRVRDMFNTAKQSAPSILFIDEIDAVGRQRGTGVGGGHDEREQTLNQILSEMDGFTPTESVMVMAATNRPDVLDQALMRPGRFDRHITVDRPSLKGRVQIFKIYIAKIPAAKDVDVDKLAKSTVGFTGADIRNLVNEATLWATRHDKDQVDMADFEFAHEKVVMGLKREEAISEKDKKKTAYHEAGHTILGWFSPINSHVHKVTIIPRGQSLGATYFLPDEEQVNINESQVRAMLVRYLGGRAAERLVFQETSAGAENDLKQATQLARRMVIHWGMSPRLGPIAFRTAESHPFLGREISEDREYSESTAKIVDEEIFRILREADAEADRILNEKRDLLEKLTEALVDEEELDQARITEILGPSPFPAQTE